MDDKTIYALGPNVENVVAKLENDALTKSEWFPNNRMKLNPDKLCGETVLLFHHYFDKEFLIYFTLDIQV